MKLSRTAKEKRNKSKSSFCIGLISMLLLVVLSGVFITACEKSDKTPLPITKQKTGVLTESKQNIIDFEILRRWTPQRGGIGMVLLVSEEATKEEILCLARHLRSNYLSKGWVLIDIFDSKEAYQHRDDPNYPEYKYSKHWLVQVSYDKARGFDSVEWLASGRDH